MVQPELPSPYTIAVRHRQAKRNTSLQTFAVQFRVESPGRVGEVGGVVRAENLKSMTYTQKQLEYIASVDGEAHISAVEIIGEVEQEREQLRKKNHELVAGVAEGIAILNETRALLRHHILFRTGGPSWVDNQGLIDRITEVLGNEHTENDDMQVGKIEQLAKDPLVLDTRTMGRAGAAIEYEAHKQTLAERDQLAEENTRLREDCEDQGDLIGRLSKLLTATANALKGDPPSLTLHDWYDLPQRATVLRKMFVEALDLLNDLARAIEHNGPGAAAFQILKVNAFLERFKEETT